MTLACTMLHFVMFFVPLCYGIYYGITVYIMVCICYSIYSCIVGRFGSRGTYVIYCLIILLNSTIPYVIGTLGDPKLMFQSKRLSF